MRRLLTEAAQAAVKAKGSHWQITFRRLLPRLGYKQALWAIAHRLCRLVWKILHDGVAYVERGSQRDPKARRQRAQTLVWALRKLGYQVELKPVDQHLRPHDFRRSAARNLLFARTAQNRSFVERAAESRSLAALVMTIKQKEDDQQELAGGW